MSEKEHAGLCYRFESKFPKLFHFESCGLLFIDCSDQSLYKIYDQEKRVETPDLPETPPEQEDPDNPERTAVKPPKTSASYLGRDKRPVIYKMPRDRGITGISIKTGKVQIVTDGERNLNYAPEIDNSVGNPCVKNCLIGPCIDTSGQLRGVIQLLNKQGSDPISF